MLFKLVQQHRLVALKLQSDLVIIKYSSWKQSENCD